MSRDSRRTLVGAALVALVAMMAAPSAQAVTAARETAVVRFTSATPGASTGVDWAIDYFNPADPNGKPPAVQENVVDFPPGSKIDTTAPVQCKASDAELTLTGPSACPAGSRVATGTLDVATGSLSDAAFPRVIHNDVTNFNNAGQSIIFTESTNTPGAQTRTVTRATVSGTTITTEVPPFPGLPPPDPYLALRRFRLRVAPLARAGRLYVTTPPSCPASRRWIFTLAFLYRDGVRQVVKSPSPCDPGSASALPRLGLTLKPNRVEAGHRTPVRLRVTRPGGLAAAGAEVSLGAAHARTGARGRATLTVDFSRPGRYRAIAQLAGFRSAGRWLMVAREDTD